MDDLLFPVATTTYPAHSFADAIAAVDRAPAPNGVLRAVADTLHAWGFGRVMLVLRDGAMAPRHVALVGHDDGGDAPDAMQPLPGVVWRQRLPMLPPFARDGLFHLPGSDSWVAREFWASDPVAAAPGEWGPLDLIVGLIHGTDGEVLGTAVLADAHPALRPDRNRWFEVYGVLRHLGTRLAHDAMRALARRRAVRLQRLQEAGATLSRSLDEREIVRELARQVVRATEADGAMIALPDLEAGTMQLLARFVGAGERAAGTVVPLGDGVIARVAREGRPVRSEDGPRRTDIAASELRSPLEALDVIGEVVGELGPPGSVVAVPILEGIRLLGVLAVHATRSGRFSAEDEEVLVTMASQAATALANARRYAESERERRQTEALADVARAVGESLRPGDVLQLILRHAQSLLDARGACIALRTGRWMHIVAGSGITRLLAGVHAPVEDSLLGRVAGSGQSIVSNVLDEEQGVYAPLQRLVPMQRTVIAPLSTGRGIIGAIAVVNRDTAFSATDARILQRLGDQVSVAIVNARLFEEVERATREWKAAFDAVATGLAVLDDARRIVRCNARLVELCAAKDVSALLGTTFPQVLWRGEAADAAVALVNRALGEQQPVRAELFDDERGLVFLVSASPHPDGGVMLAIDDVTEQRRTADGLQEIEANWRQLVQEASDSIFRVDRAGCFTFVNRSLEEASGVPRDRLLGTSCLDIIDPRDAELARDALARTMEGARLQLTVRYPDPTGATRIGTLVTAPVFDGDTIVGGFGLMRDHAHEG